MVIPWEAIASVCNELLQEEPRKTWKGIQLNGAENILSKGYSDELPNHFHEQSLLSPVEKAMSSICLITSDDGSWASGVLLNKQGLLLTNAHLLEPWRFGKTTSNGDRIETRPQEVAIIPNVYTRQSLDTFRTNLREADTLTYDNALSRHSSANINHRKIRVRLDFMDPWMWTDARVVYISKGPLDIALLQLEIVPDQLSPIAMDLDCPAPGSKAYVIGHGLFGPRCGKHYLVTCLFI